MQPLNSYLKFSG